MIELHLPAFYLGVREELEKHAGTDMLSMPVNENILPRIDRQTKWKYVRTKDGLKLTDGNLVYSFGGMPEDYPSEDARIQRGLDDNLLNFENDAVAKGTAQIHRASPDNVYMTLADGAHNPTFMLQHEGGQNWRYSPSKKFVQKLKAISDKSKENETLSVDPESLLAGARDEVNKTAELDASSAADMLNSGAGMVKDFIANHIADEAAHPIKGLATGYLLHKGVEAARDHFSPGRAELREHKLQTEPGERFRYNADTAANVALPVLASMAYMAK
jgi:hypothetical protein